jgi:hypothetical protein
MLSARQSVSLSAPDETTSGALQPGDDLWGARGSLEINAAKRLLPRLRQEYPQLPWILGGDDFYCHDAPCMAQRRDLGLHYVRVCKPTSPVELYEGVEEMERLEDGEKGQWHDGPACRWRFYTYCIARAVPFDGLAAPVGDSGGGLGHDRGGKLLYHNA